VGQIEHEVPLLSGLTRLAEVWCGTPAGETADRRGRPTQSDRRTPQRRAEG